MPRRNRCCLAEVENWVFLVRDPLVPCLVHRGPTGMPFHSCRCSHQRNVTEPKRQKDLTQRQRRRPTKYPPGKLQQAYSSLTGRMTVYQPSHALNRGGIFRVGGVHP